MESLVFSPEINELAAAHSEFLGSVADVGKAQQGYGYKYADLAQILAASRPALSAHGLSLTQFPSFRMYPEAERMVLPADSKGFAPVVIGEVTVTTTLAHKSGQWMRGVLQIPVETMKNLSVAQAVGAATSYGRRYHAASILAIAQEDNDAARPRAENPQQGRGAPRSQAPRPAAPARITQAQAQGLRDRIVAMGRSPEQFAKAVNGVRRLEDLPVTALEAAQAMLKKAEAKHYAEAAPSSDSAAPAADTPAPADQVA